MATATPGRASATSERDVAKVPAIPAAAATARSSSVGEIRLATWELVATSTTTGRSPPSSTPVVTAITTPANTHSPDHASRRGQPIASARDAPSSGVISGAISMAPTTIAVESLKTPTVAIAEANPIRAA